MLVFLSSIRPISPNCCLGFPFNCYGEPAILSICCVIFRSSSVCHLMCLIKMDADVDLKIVSSVLYEANFQNNIQRYWMKRLVIALLAYIGQV